MIRSWREKGKELSQPKNFVVLTADFKVSLSNDCLGMMPLVTYILLILFCQKLHLSLSSIYICSCFNINKVTVTKHGAEACVPAYRYTHFTNGKISPAIYLL